MARSIDSGSNVVSNWQGLQEILFADELTAGVHCIEHNGLPIDIMFQPRGSATTVVVLQERGPSQSLPVLTSGALLLDVDVNRIIITDPSLYLDGRMSTAWYAGNEFQPRLEAELARVVDRFLMAAGGVKTVFFGAHSAGFAALRFAQDFPASLALAVDPTLRMSDAPTLFKVYLEIAWGSGVPRGSFRQDVSADLSRSQKSTVVILQDSSAPHAALLSDAIAGFRVPDHTFVHRYDVAAGGADGADGTLFAKSIVRAVNASSSDFHGALMGLGLVPLSKTGAGL
ncbi:hypothetical protein ACFCZ3_12520 [Cellulosimicrobium cellulans]|uniref:hypothetical protein n=1 Tax=Cellulosimicrobium cellulans TaxID=1710 RepID=UPI0035DE433F